MRKEMNSIIKNAISQQRQSYNRGHENQGANIDVLSEVKRILSTKALSRNKKAISLLTEIHDFDTILNEHEPLKYAKSLSFPVRNYIKKEIFNLIR